jgi:LysM repeat protein
MKKLLPLLMALAVALASFSTVLADTGYIVQRGDTLYRIAARFGVTVPAIAAANHLTNVNLIHVGQRLLIPSPGSAPAPTNAPWTGQYVVQRGDTLWRIAHRFATTVDALKAANNLRSNLIYPGQILNIPGVPTPAPATPPLPVPTPTQAVCTLTWFFSPRPQGCPAAPAAESNAAAERFERGLMIWVGATDTYYVFHNANESGALRLTLVQGPLTLRPGANPNNRVGGAPAGLMEPVSGFGLLWRDEVEGVYGLRQQVGWAVEPEYAFTTTRQCEAYPGTNYPSPTCYLRAPNGAIYQTFYVQYFGNYWRAWP